jgi:hypothetical protein
MAIEETNNGRRMDSPAVVLTVQCRASGATTARHAFIKPQQAVEKQITQAKACGYQIVPH